MIRSLLPAALAALALAVAPSAGAVSLDEVQASGDAVFTEIVTATPGTGLLGLAGALSGVAAGPAIGGPFTALTLTASLTASGGELTDGSLSILQPANPVNPVFLASATFEDGLVEPGLLRALFTTSPISTAGDGFGSPVLLSIAGPAISPDLFTAGPESLPLEAKVSSTAVVPLPAPVLMLLAGLAALGGLSGRGAFRARA